MNFQWEFDDAVFVGSRSSKAFMALTSFPVSYSLVAHYRLWQSNTFFTWAWGAFLYIVRVHTGLCPLCRCGFFATIVPPFSGEFHLSAAIIIFPYNSTYSRLKAQRLLFIFLYLAVSRHGSLWRGTQSVVVASCDMAYRTAHHAVWTHSEGYGQQNGR